ncbi:MAG: HD domain-containing phosphohydrolase [Pseudomonadota bacterium]
MPDIAPESTVNQHYLNKVIDLSDEMHVEASEDIFDARGNKLLAKGARVSRALQERLIVHKLKKPLEACIVVEGGIDTTSILQAAERLATTCGPLAHILADKRIAGPSATTVLSHLRFGSAMGMMLTIAERQGAGALDHAVMVGLLSIHIAAKAGLPENEQAVAGLAGLLHDVGELYIDPAYLEQGKRLQPQEWTHLVVHPHTGGMLISQLEDFAPAVAQAVSEHHERFDGSGFPRRNKGDAISAAGQIVAIAELIASVIDRDHPLERAALSLKIIPGEHARPLLTAISGTLRGYVAVQEDMDICYRLTGDNVIELVARIDYALRMAKEMVAMAAPLAFRTRELLKATVERLEKIKRAVISSGLDMAPLMEATPMNSGDAAMLFEQKFASHELHCRMRDLARDLALHDAQSQDQPMLLPLIKLLDGDKAASAPTSGTAAANDATLPLTA